MTRTQIYLPSKQHKFLKTRAAEENITMAEFIRRLIANYANNNMDNTRHEAAGDFLVGLSRLAKKRGFKGPADLASKVDQYLYE